MTDDIQRSLGRIEAKLDGVLAAQAKHDKNDADRFAAQDTRLTGYSTRIRSLENSRAGLWGAVTALTSGLVVGVYKLFGQ